MKTRVAICLGVGMALLATPGALRASVFNGSFESADLLGWTLHSDVGQAATAPTTRLAGAAQPVNSWTGPGGFATAQTPVAGARFLAMNTRANGNFLGSDSYDITVSQSFSLNPGEFLTGWSFFFSNDSEPLDSAWVRILDQNLNPVATLWGATSGGPLTAQALATVPPAWTPWQWSTATAGNFTLQLGLTTSGANNGASFGFHDHVSISAVPVPEPSSMVLGLLGGLMFVALRHRRH